LSTIDCSQYLSPAFRSGTGVDGGTADYTDRYTFDDDASDLVMEVVGYVNGDHSPQNHDIMKASALAWCLDRIEDLASHREQVWIKVSKPFSRFHTLHNPYIA
jgi:hypothetical protein